jgi:hypothetical protein
LLLFEYEESDLRVIQEDNGSNIFGKIKEQFKF